MNVAPLRALRQHDTHRLISSKYSQGAESVLTLIAPEGADLTGLFDLEQATNDRIWAEQDKLPGINSQELVFGIRNCHIVNAAFSHPNPNGARFSGPERGAWYAGFEIETSKTEIAFHKSIEYSEINQFNDSVTYDDYLADFGGEFHDIRDPGEFRALLDPASYVASQAFAADLLESGSLGVVYPSVRNPGGTCIACFRPAAVANVRKDYRYRFTWDGERLPRITCLSASCYS